MRDFEPFTTSDATTWKILHVIAQLHEAQPEEIQEILNEYETKRIEKECENLYQRGILCQVENNFAIDPQWIETINKLITTAYSSHGQEINEYEEKIKRKNLGIGDEQIKKNWKKEWKMNGLRK